ncbi:MAG: DUF6261 family protein [Bacteroidales bacterium]|jgi:hypothetical protein|nr:DUF6261 family protein [Bacteroidales bacterium]
MRKFITIIYKSTIRQAYSTIVAIINALIESGITTDSYLNSVTEEITENTEQFSEAINRDKSYAVLNPIDEKRDNLLRILFMDTETKTLYPDKEISESALIVKGVIDRYGLKIISKPYNEETADIDSLINDLENPEIKAAISKLGTLADIIDQIKIVANEWKAAVYKQAENKEELLSKPSATKLKNSIVDTINNDLLIYIAGMAKCKPEEYAELNKRIRVIIEEHNSEYRANLKKHKE